MTDRDFLKQPVPSASPAALTDSARRLMLAADDVDMGRSIHNQRKPDDKIEGAVWDELRRASAAVRAMLAASPAEQVEDARRCQQCNAPRKGDECHKCGAPTVEPCAGWEEPALPPIDRIRELAREVGYAIGVHGTLERDLDLIAAPWSEEAAKLNYREVMQHIADGLGARLVEVEGKPLGRRACTIQMDGWYKPIDLSVCPMLDVEDARDAARFVALMSAIVATINGDPMTDEWKRLQAAFEAREEAPIALEIIRSRIDAAMSASKEGHEHQDKKL